MFDTKTDRRSDAGSICCRSAAPLRATASLAGLALGANMMPLAVYELPPPPQTVAPTGSLVA